MEHLLLKAAGAVSIAMISAYALIASRRKNGFPAMGVVGKLIMETLGVVVAGGGIVKVFAGSFDAKLSGEEMTYLFFGLLVALVLCLGELFREFRNLLKKKVGEQGPNTDSED